MHQSNGKTPLVRLSASSKEGRKMTTNKPSYVKVVSPSNKTTPKMSSRTKATRKDNLCDDDADSIVIDPLPFSDNYAEQETILDNFTTMCLPYCAPHCLGTMPKSAMKKTDGSSQGEIHAKHSVSFNSLTVREYDLTLGDHPSSASGPPVQLDWEHKNESVVDLNQYEQERQPRKTRRQLKMSFAEREQILQSRGYSVDELKNAWMESLKIRQQRYETIMTGSFNSKMEEAWESACRKFNRFFTLTQDMEGYEVKAAGGEGGSEAFAYVKKAEEDVFDGSHQGYSPTIWSSFEHGTSGCGSSLASWLVPCTGSTRVL